MKRSVKSLIIKSSNNKENHQFEKVKNTMTYKEIMHFSQQLQGFLSTPDHNKGCNDTLMPAQSTLDSIIHLLLHFL